MVDSSQIKEQLARYLSGIADFGQFEDWFVPNTRDVRRTRSEAAMGLTFAIEGALAEYLSGILSEQELRSELLQIYHADHVVAEISDTPQQVFLFRFPVVFVPVTVRP